MDEDWRLKAKSKYNGNNQSLRLRLRSSLRQSGSRFAAANYGTAEAVPLSKAKNMGEAKGRFAPGPLEIAPGLMDAVSGWLIFGRCDWAL